MILSKPAKYAIRSLLFLARKRGNGPILSSTIAAEEGLPASYLVKILGTLTVAGFVDSTRGPGGGFAMTTDPYNIRLLDVVSLFEEDGVRADVCLLGFDGCHGRSSCEIHGKFTDAVGHGRQVLAATTIGDLVDELQSLQIA